MKPSPPHHCKSLVIHWPDLAVWDRFITGENTSSASWRRRLIYCKTVKLWNPLISIREFFSIDCDPRPNVENQHRNSITVVLVPIGGSSSHSAASNDTQVVGFLGGVSESCRFCVSTFLIRSGTVLSCVRDIVPRFPGDFPNNKKRIPITRCSLSLFPSSDDFKKSNPSLSPKHPPPHPADEKVVKT